MSLFKQVPIGRWQYFKNLFLANLVLFSAKLPPMLVAYFAPENEVLFDYLFVICLLLALLIYVFIFTNTVLNRARDIEGNLHINVLKWLTLSMFPIVALYGHFLLFFKKGKSK